MMNLKNTFTALLLAACLSFASSMAMAASAGTNASNPEAVVKNFYTALTDAMKQGEKLGFTGRYKRLEPSLRSTFNFPLMTRIAVGPTAWTKATEAQQKQLISAFSDFSVATYASRFVRYDGEKFEVIDEKPASGGGVIVETKLTPGGDDKPVALNYLMQKDDKGDWRIVDVYLDGSISELATRRSEFSSIVARDGIPALVNSLGDKARQMGPS